jgi:alginate O-acetyltransferase complex protein AlgI
LLTYKPRTYLQSLSPIASFPVFNKFIQTLVTFLLVTFAWIFFRADYQNTDVMWSLIKSLGRGWPSFHEFFSTEYFMKNICMGQRRRVFFTATGLIVVLEIIQYLQSSKNNFRSLAMQPLWIRWSLYVVFILSILYLGIFDNPPQFIYFQF